MIVILEKWINADILNLNRDKIKYYKFMENKKTC